MGMHDAVGRDPSTAGAIGWCAFDYQTHNNFGSGDRICYHGVMDIFRLPKMAAHFYRSQLSPQKEPVLEAATYWSVGDRNGGGITPLTVFTNCDYIEVEVNGKELGRFYPDKERFPGLEYPPCVIDNFNVCWGEPGAAAFSGAMWTAGWPSGGSTPTTRFLLAWRFGRMTRPSPPTAAMPPA